MKHGGRISRRVGNPSAFVGPEQFHGNVAAADEFFRIFGLVRVRTVRKKPRVIETKLVARKRTVRERAR